MMKLNYCENFDERHLESFFIYWTLSRQKLEGGREGLHSHVMFMVEADDNDTPNAQFSCTAGQSSRRPGMCTVLGTQ